MAFLSFAKNCKATYCFLLSGAVMIVLVCSWGCMRFLLGDNFMTGLRPLFAAFVVSLLAVAGLAAPATAAPVKVPAAPVNVPATAPSLSPAACRRWSPKLPRLVFSYLRRAGWSTHAMAPAG